jgi:hypothetical protein
MMLGDCSVVDDMKINYSQYFFSFQILLLLHWLVLSFALHGDLNEASSFSDIYPRHVEYIRMSMK